MNPSENLVGRKFGRLSVLSLSDKRTSDRRFIWVCQCDCGNVKPIPERYLKDGQSRSCGCLSIEVSTAKIKNAPRPGPKLKNRLKDGVCSTEYGSWRSMKERCYNPNNIGYKHYGGKGVTVCERWLSSYQNFFEDMGYKPSPKHTLDRFPDMNGNYGPENCRWATKWEQDRNKNSNVWLEHNRERMIMADWAKRWGVHHAIIIYHLETKQRTFEWVYNKFNRKGEFENAK